MATADGTRQLLARFVTRGALHQANVRTLGRTGLACSAVGFGAYRVGAGPKAESHLAALRSAFRAGVNLVDTSSHYTADSSAPRGGHGTSEQLVGRAIAEAVEAGELSREGLVLCTKVGHVPRGMKEPPGSIAVGPQGGGDDFHSIHPDFIEAEVRRSVERLGTPPDFVQLHNPEYFLSDQLRARVPIADAWAEMYAHLHAAFGVLEALCDEGLIGTGYGVSANFLSCQMSTTGRPNLYEALALERVVDAAASAAAKRKPDGQHRLHLAQLPINIVEGGAVLGRGDCVPEAAEGDCALADRLGVAVIGNRPLNALPVPGVVAGGDWGEHNRGNSYLCLREGRPTGTVQALIHRVLADTIEAPAQPSELGATSLQRLALQLSMSPAPTLNGMRTEAYVADAAAVLRSPPVAPEVVAAAMTATRSAMVELGGQRRGLW